MKRKHMILVCLILLMMIGVSGCMSQNRQAVIDHMLERTEKKYNKKFEVVDFVAAKDPTFDNILTLSSDGLMFKVYQRGENSLWDDFVQVYAGNKAMTYFRSMFDAVPSHIEIFGFFRFADLKNLQEVVEMEAEELIATKRIIQVGVAIKTTKNLPDDKEFLYAVYNELCSLDPKYIEFVIIQVQGLSEELDRMLNSFYYNYNSDWQANEVIISYISTTDKSIATSDRLIKR